MQIKIGKKAYSSNPAMITLIRYYVEFRESFLAAYLSGACGALEVARLAWSSIDGPKPDFDTFLVAADVIIDKIRKGKRMMGNEENKTIYDIYRGYSAITRAFNSESRHR